MTAYAISSGRNCGPSFKKSRREARKQAKAEFFAAMLARHGAPEAHFDHGPFGGPGRGEGPRRHRRGGPFGGPPFGGPGFGPGPGGPGGPGRRGRRASRGDVRAALLLVLEDGNAVNGYQLMQEIQERSDNSWRPSPGSVYPSLQLLEDEGLIAAEQRGNGRFFTITEAGRKYIDENRDALGTPWQAASAGVTNQSKRVFISMKELAHAVHQVVQIGSEAQHAQAAEILTDARRKLYLLLAEGSSASEPTEHSADGAEGSEPKIES